MSFNQYDINHISIILRDKKTLNSEYYLLLKQSTKRGKNIFVYVLNFG